MADITMCASETCSKRNECYRALAESDDIYQSFSNFEQICNENSDFREFIPVKH